MWQNSRTSDGGVKVKEQLANFSMNVMTRMLLGKRFFGHKGAGAIEAAEFLEITEGIFLLLGVLNVSDYLPFLRPFDHTIRIHCYTYINFHKRALSRGFCVTSNIARLLVSRSSILPSGVCSGSLGGIVDVLLSLPGFDGESHLQDVEMKALIQVSYNNLYYIDI